MPSGVAGEVRQEVETTFTLARAIGAGVLVLWPLYLTTSTALVYSTVSAVIVGTCALVMALLHRGYVATGAHLLVWSMLLPVFFGMVYGGHAEAHGMAAPMLPLLFAALILRRRGVVTVALALALALGFIVYGERAGFLPLAPQPRAPADLLVAHVSVTALAAMWVLIVGRQFQRTLREAHAVAREGATAAAHIRETAISRAVLERVFERIGHGVVVTDAAGHVLRTNAAMATLDGRVKKGVVLPGLFGGQADTVWRAALDARRKAVPRQLSVALPSGIPVYLSVASLGAGAPGAADGELARRTARAGGWVFVVRDRRADVAQDEQKSAFVSFVSHELRTPLTAMRGALGLLLSTKAESAQLRDLLGIALKNTKRLGRLVDDILDVERFSRDDPTLELSHVCVGDVLGDLVRRFDESGAHRGDVVLTVRARKAEIFADENRFIQVMENLLDNAASFAPDGSRIEVDVDVFATRVRVTVRDHGPGFPADYLPHLFERFRQADGSDTRQRDGTGLGLALCKAIVEKHGGRIVGDNHPEGGARMAVTWPRSPERRPA